MEGVDVHWNIWSLLVLNVFINGPIVHKSCDWASHVIG